MPPLHTFLVLDRHSQPFPWESIPILRGRSLSRIPSLAFLADHLRLPSTGPTSPAPRSDLPPSLSYPSEIVARSIDSSKGFFIINPSGDLVNTQGRFDSWRGAMEARGWQGIVGRAPSEGELIKALTSYDVVV